MNYMDFNVEVLLEENDEFSSFLNKKIKEFNNEHSFHHNVVRKKGTIQPINIIVMDENKQWIGGITAEVWNWLEINDFWFSEEIRGKGLGSILLDKTEDISRDKGATKVLLTTFEFQARTFYEMRGYKVVGEVKDYPPGSSYYTLVKSL